MKQLGREVLQQVRFWGARGLVRSFHHAVLDSWASLRRPRPRGPFQSVGRPLKVEPLQRGARVVFERAEAELHFLLPDLLQVTWQPGLLPLPYAIVEQEWPSVRARVEEQGGGWEIATGELSVVVDRSGTMSYFGRSSDLLREDLPPERRDDEWRHVTRLAQEEQLYGLGERTGPLNLRGRTQRLWNTDPMASYGPDRSPLYLNVPVYQSLRRRGGYFVFYENSFPATFSFDAEVEATGGGTGAKEGQARANLEGGTGHRSEEERAHLDGETRPGFEGARAHFEGGALRYYLIPGTPDETLERYTRLTGRPPLPPRWALGYHQSRFSYETEEAVREVAEGFSEHDLPLSAIHLDIHYMDGFRVFTVDEQRYPDLAGLALDLEQQGVRLVTILDPGVKRDPDYRVYREGLERGMFARKESGEVAVGPVWPGWCAFPDFTDPKVREWWGEQYHYLLDAGVEGIWHDMNEPTLTALWGERALAHEVKHEMEGRGGNHFEAHNLYGLLMTRTGFEALRELRPERRPFILSRSGWAGIQRYAWTWTGDISSSWAMLRQTISTVLNLGLSGMPYSGPDIGGFKGSLTDEQYLRWFELATFLPFYRTHSALLTPKREPWRFGPELLASIRDLLELRMELMPYLYTLAHEASRTGHPLVRPLYWGHWDEERLWDRDDAFLLGDSLLVAPVLGEGESRRRVELPPGEWYGFWGDEVYSGKAEVAAPLGRPPLFMRAGSVVPRADGMDLVLHVYPPTEDPGHGGGRLYADEGEGYGPTRVDRFDLEHRDGELALSWSSEGEYRLPFQRVAVDLHGVKIDSASLDGEVLASSEPQIWTTGFRKATFNIEQ